MNKLKLTPKQYITLSELKEKDYVLPKGWGESNEIYVEMYSSLFKKGLVNIVKTGNEEEGPPGTIRLTKKGKRELKNFYENNFLDILSRKISECPGSLGEVPDLNSL